MTTQATEATAATFLQPIGRAAIGALVLVAAGDLLVLGHEPGLNLFIYTLAVGAGIVLVSRHLPRDRPMAVACVLALVLALPLLEATSLPGLFLAALGLAVLALSASGHLPDRATAVPQLLFRFLLVAPFRFLEDGMQVLAGASEARARSGWGRNLLAWVVPLLFAVLFIALFAAANPLVEAALAYLDPLDVLRAVDAARVIFWVLLAAMLWPVLRPRLLGPRQAAAVGPVTGGRESVLVGRAAILRSLVVFNVLFAVQTLLDLAYLWGGVTLPGGMTHAEYAHRGAYPLVATALLAAVFVLAAMRRGGPGEASPLIRGLVYAWIAQNVLLCLSAILRLELYVEIYGLTELRLAAGVWMVLVATGLVLILFRILQRRSDAWLIATNLLSLTVALYGYALADVSALVAGYNVSHSRDLGGAGQPLDVDYLRALGPSAIPALDHYLAAAGRQPTETMGAARQTRQHLAEQFARRPEDWRSWTLRDARLESYLAAKPVVASAPGTGRE